MSIDPRPMVPSLDNRALKARVKLGAPLLRIEEARERADQRRRNQELSARAQYVRARINRANQEAAWVLAFFGLLFLGGLALVAWDQYFGAS